MSTKPHDFSQIIHTRNLMLQKQKEIYISAAEKMNMQIRDLLRNDFGNTLFKNTAKDLAGEVARRFFDFGDYYISVDQMYDRFVHFSYENDVDQFGSNEGVRKALYNVQDSDIASQTMKNISARSQEAQKKLFTEDRQADKHDIKGKKAYRTSRTMQDGKIHDELTGREGVSTTVLKNGREELRSDIQADHVQARASISYNSRYIREDKIEKLKEFYHSADNMQMMHASANASKGDVRVCTENGNVIYLNAKEMRSRQEKGEPVVDITSQATVEQLVEATVAQWEKETPSGNKTTVLKEKGYLDENGKVKQDVKKELERKIRHSQNAESIEILKDTKYREVTQDAAAETAKSFRKIVTGQVIYYVLPPLIFETQTIIKRKDITLNAFYTELKKAGKRVIRYVLDKLGTIFRTIAGNSFNKFIKTFFDIILSLVKATVKKLIKAIKQVVMSLISCGKILMDKQASAAQKADAITKTLAVSINAVVMELLFEYLEKQLGLPDILMEPLQIIITIISTNIIMLVLQKVDLFDVQYGMLVSNIERIFDETNEAYRSDSEALLKSGSVQISYDIKLLTDQLRELRQSIADMDVYEFEVTPQLEKWSELFGIEF